MRLGRVEFNTGYVVDLDNEDMIQHAIDAVWEDIMALVKQENSPTIITDGNFSEEDIPEFLLDEEELD